MKIKIARLVLFAFTNMYFVTCFAQQNEIWQRSYGIPDRFDIIYSAKSSYDHGYVVGLNASSETPNEYHIWLVKTDINGDILWSKSLYNPDILIYLASFDIDENGGIVLTGQINQYDDQGDVFIMRLNACGEKVWCKVIRYKDMNYGYRIKIRSDGNYALYTRYAASSYYDANKLWTIDTNGNILSSFRIIPPGSHPNIGAPLVSDFVLIENQEYLFCGHCYFPEDTVNPTMWRLQHMLAKFDSVGNEIWVRPQYLDTNHEGVILSAIEDEEVFYAVGYDYQPVKKEKQKDVINRPYNGKFAQDGHLIFEKKLHPDTLMTYLMYLKEMTDGSIIQAGKITHDLSGAPPYFLGVYKTDTMFTILEYLENDTGSVTNECITSSIDGKFLITGYCPAESSYTEVDGLAIKVNSDLQYDSLYSFPFVYDSLCSFPILTDTIDCDCDIITGYENTEHPAQPARLQLSPNPAREKVWIGMIEPSESNIAVGRKLVFYDLYGRKILERDFRQEAQVDIAVLKAGIYLVAVEQNGRVLARGELVVL